MIIMPLILASMITGGSSLGDIRNLGTMAIVFKAVGLPLEGIGIILAVDRVCYMCRTSLTCGETV